MRDYEETLGFIKGYLQSIARWEQERIETLNNKEYPQGFKDEQDVRLNGLIRESKERIVETLRHLTTFPPYHDVHDKYLAQFHQDSPFEKSVFIMTKFPNPKGDAPKDKQLARVIQAVIDAVKLCQHVPRIASENDYHESLWNNVELHLLGCSKGIAIVENKYLDELNPNVAMEWGWMRGLGRRVIYLVEKSFNKERADWGGLIEYRFDWDAPEEDIKEGVHKGLRCPLVH